MIRAAANVIRVAAISRETWATSSILRDIEVRERVVRSSAIGATRITEAAWEGRVSIIVDQKEAPRNWA